MIPQKELDQLIQYYKGELTENALLNKAATLAAKKHLLLADPQLPPALVNAQTKPLSQELTKLTKRIRQFPGGVGVGAPGGPPGEEEEGGLVTGPVEQWLKRMIKGSPSTSKPLIPPSTKKVSRQERNPFHQSRRYPVPFRSRVRTSQDLGKTFSGKCFGKRQRTGSKSGTVETLARVGRLGPWQNVETSLGLRQ